MLLISLHIFIQPVLLGILVVECVAFLVLFISGKHIQAYSMCQNCLLVRGKGSSCSVLYTILTIIAAIISVIWVVNLFINNLGTIFTDNDAVGAYNVWAVSLTQGKVPSTAYYPMLVVSNWAVGYVISGCTLQFAAKAMMPLFFIFILVLLICLYISEQKNAYLLAVSCVCIIAVRMSEFYICEGSMDYAISFFTVGGIYCLIRAMREKADNGRFRMYIWMAGVMAICVGVTKQAGLLIAPLLVLLAFFFGLFSHISKKQICLFLSAFGLIVLTFYLWSFIGVLLGTNASYVDWLVGGIHGGRNLLQRILFSAWSVYGYWLILFPFMIIVALVSLMNTTFRWVDLAVFFPYTIVWMLGFSYDTRNWTVGTILWGIAIAFGIDYIIELIYKKIVKTKIVDGIILLLIFFACGSILYRIPSDTIISEHVEQEKLLVDPELNEALYSYFEENEIDGKILSYMSHVGKLPELGDYYVGARLNFASDDEFDAYLQQISNKEVGYIVFPDIQTSYEKCPLIKADLQKKIDDNELSIVWANGIKMFAVVNRDSREED